MDLHSSTFQYLKPTEEQLATMARAREAFQAFADEIELLMPEGADAEHVARLIRTAAMWANVAITREDDGSPRT